ncbi:MAG: HAMP domain-containing protein, partial [Clostridia bacterium]|nr:HAMP domain-containing protein [Clostridia bacterium]
MSFKAKILTTISVLMFASLSIFGFISYIDTKKNSVAQVEQSLQMASRALTDYIDVWIAGKKSGVESASRYLSNIHSMNENQIIAILRETNLALGGCDVTIGLEDKTVYTATGDVMPDDYDPRVRDWYKTIKTTQKVGVADAYMDASTNKLIVSIMAPIMKDGKFLGGVVLDISLDLLIRAISDINFNGGYGTLIDTQGIFIAHPNKEFLGKTLKYENAELAQKALGKDVAFIEYLQDGKAKLFSFKVSKETGGWIPAITFDKEVAYSFLSKQMSELFIAGIIMLILSIGIMILLIKALLKPLDNLNGVVEELSSSEGDLRQRLSATANDEFAQVSRNINKFIEKLHEIVK